jgi:hypothetical protein
MQKFKEFTAKKPVENFKSKTMTDDHHKKLEKIVVREQKKPKNFKDWKKDSTCGCSH